MPQRRRVTARGSAFRGGAFPGGAFRGGALWGVVAVGMVARAALLPITHGQDFTVWDLATRGTIDGHNIYAHHPHYPGGPFAYFPLFLYVELPFRWLALHGAGTFTVWGKLPIVAADVWCAALIAAELRDRGCSERAVALGCGVFFLNPLVLYNSAYYGRFDSLGLALLLLAVRSFRRHGADGRAWPWWYGLSIAAKTFPAFVILGLGRAASGSRARLVAGAVGVPVVLSLPYLASSRALGHDLLVHDLIKSPQGLSWQYLLAAPLGPTGAKIVGFVMLAAFVGIAWWLTSIDDIALYCATVLAAFCVASKYVLEQYLVWPMPFLVVVALAVRGSAGRAAWCLLTAFTVFGLVDNESWHPVGRSSFVSVLVGVAAAAYVTVTLRFVSATRVALPA